MFYLDPNGYDFDLDVSEGKEGDIDEDDRNISNEVPFLNMDYQDCTSCVSQDYSDDHSVIKSNEEENIEALHQKLVVMLGPLVNSSPYDLIDALNMEINSIGIILGFFD